MEFFFSIFNWSPLSIAAYNGQDQIVQLLLDQPGIDVNIQDISIQLFQKISRELFYGVKLQMINGIQYNNLIILH